MRGLVRAEIASVAAGRIHPATRVSAIQIHRSQQTNLFGTAAGQELQAHHVTDHWRHEWQGTVNEFHRHWPDFFGLSGLGLSPTKAGHGAKVLKDTAGQ